LDTKEFLDDFSFRFSGKFLKCKSFFPGVLVEKPFLFKAPKLDSYKNSLNKKEREIIYPKLFFMEKDFKESSIISQIG